VCSILLEQDDYLIDFETNATIIPHQILDDKVHTYVCSPKLSNSNIHENLRIKKEAMVWFANNDKSFFKFVAENESDFIEINRLTNEFNIDVSRVFVMAQAMNIKELNKREGVISDLSLKHGYRYTDRLHLRLYGGGRGV